jgi:hypothetical protein
MRFERLGIDDGLSQQAVLSIAQDPYAPPTPPSVARTGGDFVFVTGTARREPGYPAVNRPNTRLTI